jgi:probable rRNA maturation factor
VTGMNVVLANRQRTRKINRRLLKQITVALFADLKVEAAEFGLHLIAAPEMIRLNEKFLQHAGPTDVITFNYANSAGQASHHSHSNRKEFGDRQDACPTVHGEIFICVDEAVLQARKFRASWQSEITRYLVHGVLHLLGHDDSRPAERRKMKRAENRRLRELSRRFSLAHLARPGKLSPCKNH